MGIWRALAPSPHLLGQVAFDPARQTPVLLARGAGLRQHELWAWDGQRFQLDVADLFPHQPPGTVQCLMSTVDPAGDRLLVFGRTEDGVVEASGARAVLRPRTRRADRASWQRVTSAVVLGDTVLFVGRDGAVFTRDGQRLVVAHRALPDLADEADELRSVVVDPERGVLTAASTAGRLHTFTLDDGWHQVGDARAWGVSLAWDPIARRVVVLSGPPGEDRWTGAPSAGMWLRGWPADAEPGTPPPLETRAPFGWHQPLVFDRARRQWLLLASADEVWVSPSGAAWTRLDQPHRLENYYHAHFTWTAGGPLRASMSHHWGPTMTLVGDRWLAGSYPSGETIWQHHNVAAAVPDGLVRLDPDGALHHLPAEGECQRLTAPWGGLAGLNTLARPHAVLCHDPAADRLVLWAGGDGAGWVFRDGAWTALPPGPPAGRGLLCGTERGTYLLVAGELWLLTPDDAWAPVGSAPDWPAHVVFTSGGALWSVSDRQVARWSAGRFEPLLELPEPVSLTQEADRVSTSFVPSVVAYDPLGDRLVVHGPSGVWELSVSGLAAADAVLPEPVGPAVPAAAAPPAPVGPSCYLLEFSVAPGGARHAWIYAHGTLADAVDSLHAALSCPDPDERELLASLVRGGTLHLWVVRGGTLTEGVDLHPFLVREAGDTGDTASVRPPRVDLAALAGVVPELTGPTLASDGYLVVSWTGPRPDPDTFSYLRDGIPLRAGFNDLES
ncbi:hypothetical protein LX83_002984 [Goodfellowiella coeruleoviolacea]|uniref:Uncharacterized protein n=2 Tax=Goodfellowiella coeruleoviolacea TaxID=334858 RepID=A0AAE3GF08_9PSEU|nr:hypothetical protein [Goodfellowiella coeruleoviolacea]